jgi:hypothetical protein
VTPPMILFVVTAAILALLGIGILLFCLGPLPRHNSRQPAPAGSIRVGPRGGVPVAAARGLRFGRAHQCLGVG